MAQFTGKLNSNEIFAALYNMLISQQVYADNISGDDELVNDNKVDGTLYGDTKLYYATDALFSSEWGNDAEATNLLALDRPEAPEVQALVLDQFRQIRLTVDNYLSKRAWANEGAFASFNGVMKGWIQDTKRIYDGTTFNVFFGTYRTTEGAQDIKVKTSGITETGEAKDRKEAQMIAQTVARTLKKVADYSRDYNDYGNLRRFAKDSLTIVWNSAFVDKITNIDLPTMYHKDLFNFSKELEARYFGDVIATAGTSDGTKRSMIEQIITNGTTKIHVFAGDLIPDGYKYDAYKAYTENSNIICKIYKKGTIPYMSAFEVATSFFNPRSLTENNYLTFGHNTLEVLKNYPFITIEAN